MDQQTIAEKAVVFQSDGITINGQKQILLCASLFYFRIPRAYWKERMEQLKAFGYNSIDVYFPWNYHELSEGKWDFSGERDVEAFLTLAAEVGLLVVARPGPYICSEWDGGALPAYLLAKEDMRLRDNDPQFLHYVSQWFERIIPLLKAKQVNEGGTVIAIQLDNELDFYSCSDPRGYIGALRDIVQQHGITVPLFACSGQSGILQATGLADEVVPSCNFYPFDRDPEFEQKVLHYEDIVTGLGYPLLVTETNRSHYLLRRLLSCGAKLLGPYLQVSGTDFGFTNATNNWGRPLAFMTSDYDFGGMISPEGHIRSEAYEGRLLARLIKTYGDALALAKTSSLDAKHDEWSLNGDAEGIAGPQPLKLNGGGYLAFISNLEDQDKQISIVNGTIGTDTFTLKGRRSLALPFHVPLSIWGAKGVLESSNAELYMSLPMSDGVALLFHTEGQCQIVLRMEQPNEIRAEKSTASYSDGKLYIASSQEEQGSSCYVHTACGRKLTFIVHKRDQALLVEGFDEHEILTFAPPIQYTDQAVEVEPSWRMTAFEASQPITGGERKPCANYLEQENIYRGYAWYQAAVDTNTPQRIEGILVRNASDVVSIYGDNQYAGTVVPGGGTAYIPLQQRTEVNTLLARVEIWGHSNFDDIRLPALRLNAMKGLTGMAAITKAHRLSSNWKYSDAADIHHIQVNQVHQNQHENHLQHAQQDHPDYKEQYELQPIVGFGSWISALHPAFECYSRTFQASSHANCWFLSFQGLQLQATLFVNGHDVGLIDAFDPYVDITPYVAAGEDVELTVCLERVRGLSAGNVMLYEGIEATNWSVSSAETEQLHTHAAELQPQAVQVQLPLLLEAGSTAWLYADTANSQAGKGWRVKVEGSALKLTVLFAGQIIGRLWLPQSSSRPTMTGGSPASFYIPGAWYDEDGAGSLSIMLEAVGDRQQGMLESLQFIAI